VAAAPPKPLSADELSALGKAAAPRAAQAATALNSARETFATDSKDSANASAAAKTFLIQADIPLPADDNASEAKPLDVKPGPGDTVISSDGGMYFDADEGIFVYLKNVRVKDPRFELSGAEELKIFIGKKPATAADDTRKDGETSVPGLGLGAKFGDVERIIATGAVRILQKEVEAGKQPVEASGAVFTYHLNSGEIVINGGYPWVKQGANFMRAKQPNLILRIQKNGSFVTEGSWEMGGNLDAKP
jgi:lipopolysaccharide export system protein LptA